MKERFKMKNIKCPHGHIDTYKYDSTKDSLDKGLMLMCNVCEDGYQLKQTKGE
tara:strand:+ start:254 stop:412 length:159 start_codon:yes stop_codon:yes gene_type:complete